MTRPDQAKLAELKQLTDMLRDQALMQLQKRQADCMATVQHIAALDAALPTDSPLPPHLLQDAAMRHARWVAPRRMRLNEILALQTAARLTAEQEARRAFGRARAVDHLIQRQQPADQ